MPHSLNDHVAAGVPRQSRSGAWGMQAGYQLPAPGCVALQQLCKRFSVLAVAFFQWFRCKSPGKGLDAQAHLVLSRQLSDIGAGCKQRDGVRNPSPPLLCRPKVIFFIIFHLSPSCGGFFKMKCCFPHGKMPSGQNLNWSLVVHQLQARGCGWDATAGGGVSLQVGG